MDGKNQFYNRPVLIVRKFNSHIFFGVPLTTKMNKTPCGRTMTLGRRIPWSRRYILGTQA
jgi:hypothetical protein